MKTRLAIAIAATTALSLPQAGCQKDRPLPESGATTLRYHPGKQYRHAGPALTYYRFGTDITEDHLLKNPADAADEKYNYVEYALTLGLLEIYKSPDLTAALVNAIVNKPGKCYDVMTFADEHPGVDQIFNTVFASRFNDFSSFGSNWRDYVAANYKYDVHYRPFAHFANEGYYSLDEVAYIGGPFEVDEEVFPEFDDDIPVWLNTDGGQRFTTIDKEEAQVTRNPILLISNGHAGDDNVGVNTGKNPSTPVGLRCNIPSHVHEKLSHRQFRIDYRYERTGRSEYTFLWVSRVPYFPATMSWGGGTNSIAYGLQQKKVERDEIGNLFDFDFKAFSPDMWTSGNPVPCFEIAQMAFNPGIYSTLAVGAYEEDWYASDKLVLTTSNGINDFASRYPRKYDNEWYFLDPNTNNSYPFNDRNPTPNSMYTNTIKGLLKLERNYD